MATREHWSSRLGFRVGDCGLCRGPGQHLALTGGALDTPLPGSRDDLFVAGIYDRKQSSLPYSELEFLTEDRGDYPYSELVPLPFPFAVRTAVDGRPLDLVKGPWREHRRRLDLQRAMLFSHSRFEDDRGRRTVVETWRCASLADPHLLMQEVCVTCENYSGLVEIDASPWDPDLPLDHPHLRPLEVNVPGVWGLASILPKPRT